jgi:hypothetical protein
VGSKSAKLISIVVTSLKEIDALIRDAVYQTVFLGNAARPATRKHKSQWFRFSWALERVPQDRFNQVENSDRDGALIFNPKT